jgi:hypothetical protein
MGGKFLEKIATYWSNPSWTGQALNHIANVWILIWYNYVIKLSLSLMRHDLCNLSVLQKKQSLEQKWRFSLNSNLLLDVVILWLNAAKAHSDSLLCYKKKCHFWGPRHGQTLKSDRISVFLGYLSNKYSVFSIVSVLKYKIIKCKV